MKALILKESGTVDNFEYVDIEKPAIKPGYVLVEVHASSINQIDIKIRQGLPIGPVLPAPLGCDMAGVVAEIGEGVTGFKVGDQVYGCVAGVKGNSGALAEFILADADLIAHKPGKLSMKQAAAMPLVSIAAWEALKRAQVGAHDHVLVQGAMGGVGHIAVQLAVQLGATVSATVLGEHDDTFLKKAGVANVIDVSQASVQEYVDQHTNGKGFDVVFDTVGGANLDRAFEGIGLNGRVAAIAARSTHDLSPLHAKNASLHVVFMLLPMLNGAGRAAHGVILKQLTELVEAGKVHPLVDEKDFTLAQGGQAQSYLESGKARGKVVVSIK